MFAVPHTPAVLADPDAQSLLEQHPPEDTHRFVFGQFLNPVLQVMPQVPEVALQTAIPFDVGAGHPLQPAPQKLGLLSDWQIPEQLWVPAGQTPLHAVALAMQAPLQSLLPFGQAGTQARPSHVTVPPPAGVWQGAQDVGVGPQVAAALLLTHLPLQTWKPLVHIKPQTPATQAAVPFGSVGQVRQVGPQPVGSLSGAQRIPHRW